MKTFQKKIEEHEVDPLIEEEEPEKEAKDQEKTKEKEPSQTPSKLKFLQKYHREEQIIGNMDEGMQTRRRMTSTPKKNDVAPLSTILLKQVPTGLWIDGEWVRC